MDGEIGHDELEDVLADPDARIVDIRNPQAFARAHLPDSENVPIDRLVEDVERFDGAGRVVTVCPHGQASQQAARLLAAYEVIVPSLYLYPWAGIRPKYFAFCFAALALLLAVDERYLSSGAAAAVAPAFWQLGVGIPLLVVGMGLHRGGHRGFLRAIAGGGLVAGVVVLPFVLTGRGIPLFVQTVVAPLYGVKEYTIAGLLVSVFYEIGWNALLVPVGITGWLSAVKRDPSRYGWGLAGTGLYLAALFVEFQGAIDFALLTPFLAVGVGLMVARVPDPSRQTLAALAVVLVLVGGLYWAEGPATPVKDEVGAVADDLAVPAYANLPPDPAGSPSMTTIYWEKRRPDTCHYRLDHKRKHFVAKTGGSLQDARCDEWPFEQPPAAWVADRVLPG